MTIDHYEQLLKNSSNVLTLIESWERGLDEDAILFQDVEIIKDNLKELKEALIEGFKK